MSNLADKTEYRALSVIARMVKQFEKLHYMNMTKIDDWEATQARNLLEGTSSPTGTKSTMREAVKHRF